MNSEDNRMPMSTVLTISAAFAAVFLILFMWVGDFGFWGALLLGLLVGIVVFVILTVMFTGQGGTGTGTSSTQSTGGAAKPAAAASAGGGAAAGEATRSDASAPAKAEKAKPKAAQSGGASAAEAKPGSSVKTPVGPAEAASAASAAEAVPEGNAPGAQAGPRGDGADNLKEIKGVGPKLEQMLNGMGIYHFDQIANWGEADIAWADGNLKGFKGRVSRDGWVEQAKILASGGETEFSKKVDKGGVY